MFHIIEKRNDNTTIAVLYDEPTNRELANHPLNRIQENRQIIPPNRVRKFNESYEI